MQINSHTDAVICNDMHINSHTHAVICNYMQVGGAWDSEACHYATDVVNAQVQANSLYPCMCTLHGLFMLCSSSSKVHAVRTMGSSPAVIVLHHGQLLPCDRLTSLDTNTLDRGSGHTTDARLAQLLNNKGKPPGADDGLAGSVTIMMLLGQ